ncbi:MAG: hypothetical protein AAGI90_04690 [Chlamydiota bacterium]
MITFPADPRMHYPDSRSDVNSGPNNGEEAKNEQWNNGRDARIASAIENISNLNTQIASLKERRCSNFKHTFLSTGIACGAVSLACSSLDYQGLDRVIINPLLVAIAFTSVAYTFFLTYNTNNDIDSAYGNIIRHEREIIREYENTITRLGQNRRH